MFGQPFVQFYHEYRATNTHKVEQKSVTLRQILCTEETLGPLMWLGQAEQQPIRFLWIEIWTKNKSEHICLLKVKGNMQDF
jgi:hypothetical protein